MAYTPNEWACGDTLTAEKLNNIERGISEMNDEYVPTEWQCGDTITAEKLNKIEQGIASGGGSSDFSTATVTVTAPGGNYYIPNVVDGEYSFLSAFVSFGTQGTQNFTVPLYKGVVGVLFDNNTIEGSGNVEIHGEVAIITGDCTITISDGGGIDDHANA